MKYVFWILFIFVFNIGYNVTSALDQNANNLGFVKGSITYSKDDIFEGDKVKIYTFVFNPESSELKGTVIFFDKAIYIGKTDFTIAPNGVKSIASDWVATEGNHEIFAKIENTKFLKSNGKYQDIYLSDNETDKSIKIVKNIQTNNATKTNEVLGNYESLSTKEDALTGITSEKIHDSIVNTLPVAVLEPISDSFEKLENIRESLGTAIDNKKNEIKKSIISVQDMPKKTNSKIINIKNDKPTKNEDHPDGKFLKPWRQVQLFFLIIISFIVNHEIIYYFSILLIIFYLFSYIYKLFTQKK